MRSKGITLLDQLTIDQYFLLKIYNHYVWICNMRKRIGVKICPKCKRTRATTNTEIEKLFGYRNNGGYHIEQSWCKECR